MAPELLELATKPDATTRIDHYLAHVAATRAALPGSVRHLVGDGFYGKLKWVSGILALDLEVIGKLRCDANLQYVYEGAQKAKGDRRKYDGCLGERSLAPQSDAGSHRKVCFDDLSRWQALGEVKPNVRLYNAVVWSINLKRKIRVVYWVNQCRP